MDEIIVRFPARHQGLAMAVEKMRDCVVAFETEASKRRGVDYRAHERALAAHANEIERQAHGISLAAIRGPGTRTLLYRIEITRVLRGVAHARRRQLPCAAARPQTVMHDELDRATGPQLGRGTRPAWDTYCRGCVQTLSDLRRCS